MICCRWALCRIDLIVFNEVLYTRIRAYNERSMNSSTFIHCDRICNIAVDVLGLHLLSHLILLFSLLLHIYVLRTALCGILFFSPRPSMTEKILWKYVLGMFDWVERTTHIPGAYSVNGMTSVGMFCNDMRFIVCWKRNLLKIIYI